MNIRLDIKAFNALSLDELYKVLWLRDIVFVVGQKITSESEVDGLDPECHHALLWNGDHVIGTARIFADRQPSIVGRVAVHPDFQHQGLGRKLMEHIGIWLAGRPSELHAQAHLEDWYQSLGWTRHGDSFVEAEIPHVMMTLNLTKEPQ